MAASSSNVGYGPAPDMTALSELFGSNENDLSTPALEDIAREALLVLEDQEPSDVGAPSTAPLPLLLALAVDIYQYEQNPVVQRLPIATAASSHASSSSTSNGANSSSAIHASSSMLNRGAGNDNNPSHNGNGSDPPQEGRRQGEQQGPNRRTGDRCEYCIRNKKGCDGAKPTCGRCSQQKNPDCRWPSGRMTHTQLKKMDKAGGSASASTTASPSIVSTSTA